MEIKLNSGAIFKNTYKQEGDTKPDYKGQINVDGTIKEIALWIKRPEGKTPYFSVAIKEPYVKPSETTPETEQHTTPEPIPVYNDLPF